MKQKTILITGGAGYIGSVLVRQLLQNKYKVKVVDLLRFGGESLLEVQSNPNFSFYPVDIRNKNKIEPLIKDVDSIVHLAAIVGDPACKQEPKLTKSINLNGSKQLYKMGNKAGCKQFIFASTCSNYGKMTNSNKYINEKSPLNPISLYAETKVSFEKFLLKQPKTNKCKPTCLRFATVYGIGPRVRFDLTVNEFTKELALGKELLIFGEQFWRPYCHVADLTRAIELIIKSKSEKVAFDIFNVGNTKENYTKKMIVNEIMKQLPKSKIRYVKKEEDPRDYKVNFDKIKNKLKYKTTKKVKDGIKEIISLVKSGLISNTEDQKYYNSKK